MKIFKTKNGGVVKIGDRESTANLKKRIDGLVIAQGFGIYGGKSFNDKNMQIMREKQEILEKQFYSRRNHKQFIKKK